MNIYLLIDTSRSMAEGAPAKLDYAKKVAAALGYIGLKNLDRARRRVVFDPPASAAHLGARSEAGAQLVSFSRPTFLRRRDQLARGDSFLHKSFSPSRFRGGRQRPVRSRRLARGLGGVDRETLPAAGDPHCRRARNSAETLGRCRLGRRGRRARAQIFSRRRFGAPLSSGDGRAISKRSKPCARAAASITCARRRRCRSTNLSCRRCAG